jgi:hypothetical protein
MNTEFQTLDGKRLDVSSLEQGTDFLAIVSLRNPGNPGTCKDMALTRIFPSGWEIQNMRMFESNLGKFDQPAYEDIRDDRVYSYFDLPSGRTMKFAVKLTASYAGKFYLPAIYCEAMYKNDISAAISGRWVEVIKPGN